MLFQHKMDPLVRQEFNEQAEKFNRYVELTGERIAKLNDDLAAVEGKLDEVLKRLDTPVRSISNESAKPEPLAMSPGHVPWSQRKKAREQKARDPNFAARIVKSTATTEPKTEGEEPR